MICEECGSTEFITVQGETAIAALGCRRCAYFFSHGVIHKRERNDEAVRPRVIYSDEVATGDPRGNAILLEMSNEKKVWLWASEVDE